MVLDLPDDPAIAAMTPEARAQVARVWRERTACEQRAAVIFSIVARDLFVSGAVPEVLSLATRAVHDELRHLEICRHVTARYAGAPEPWPPAEPAPIPGFRGASPELTRLLFFVLNTCIAESTGAAFLQACRADAEGPLVRAALQQILRDDIGHARIGWAHLASDRVDPEHRKALAHALPALLAAVRRGWADRCDEPFPPAPGGHGCSTPQAILAAVEVTLHEVVVPGFEHVGVDTGPARRWLRETLGG